MLACTGGENDYNLFVVRKNSDAATDEERARLEVGWVGICTEDPG